MFGSAVELFLLDGGEGLAVYSVSDRVLSFGVWGVCVPFGVGFSSMMICTMATVDIAYEVISRTSRLQTWGTLGKSTNLSAEA